MLLFRYYNLSLNEGDIMKNKKNKILVTVFSVLIVVLAVVTVILTTQKTPKTEPVITDPPTETTTMEPLILLSEIKHEFQEKEIIGRVVSEDLGIDCNLVFGTSDDCLRLGAGIHKTSSLPGYSTPPVIAGHVQTVFVGFQNAEVGKTISIEMPYGTYVYKIAKIEVIEKSEFDFSILNEPIKQAIFYTCYPFGKVNYVKTKRMFLYCDYVSGDRIFDDVHFTIPDELKNNIKHPN